MRDLHKTETDQWTACHQSCSSQWAYRLDSGRAPALNAPSADLLQIWAWVAAVCVSQLKFFYYSAMNSISGNSSLTQFTSSFRLIDTTADLVILWFYIWINAQIHQEFIFVYWVRWKTKSFLSSQTWNFSIITQANIVSSNSDPSCFTDTLIYFLIWKNTVLSTVSFFFLMCVYFIFTLKPFHSGLLILVLLACWKPLRLFLILHV